MPGRRCAPPSLACASRPVEPLRSACHRVSGSLSAPNGRPAQNGTPRLNTDGRGAPAHGAARERLLYRHEHRRRAVSSRRRRAVSSRRRHKRRRRRCGRPRKRPSFLAVTAALMTSSEPGGCRRDEEAPAPFSGPISRFPVRAGSGPERARARARARAREREGEGGGGREGK